MIELCRTSIVKDFENDIDKYLDLVTEEDICITLNGNVIAKLSKPDTDESEVEE